MATVLSGISGAFYYKPAGTLSTFGTADVTTGLLSVTAVNGLAANLNAATAGSNGGTFTIAADGSYVFNLGTDFDELADGESTTTSIGYTISDGESGTLTITVTGSNDGVSGWVVIPTADADTGSITENLTPADALLNVGANLNFKPGDPVKFLIRNTQTGLVGAGTLPGGITAGDTYYIIGYNSSTGVATVSSSATLTPVITLTNVGTLAAPNKFEIYYGQFAAVAEVRDWSLEISRTEIDVTTIGKSSGQYVPFRSYISGFGDANGSANVYMTDEDQALANRMVQDVLLRNQVGASVKLYVERIEANGVVDDTKSRSIELEVTLTSASLNVNPDDGQSVAINFRPTDGVTFDLATT